MSRTARRWPLALVPLALVAPVGSLSCALHAAARQPARHALLSSTRHARHLIVAAEEAEPEEAVAAEINDEDDDESQLVDMSTPLRDEDVRSKRPRSAGGAPA